MMVDDDGDTTYRNATVTLDDAIFLADSIRDALKPEYQHQVGIFALVETS